jgi:ESS family glutamate:Na+ symporter
MMLAVGGIGFSMGITANGLSNMQSLCEKYGPAMRVIFIVVIVGMILVGITNSFVVGAMLGCL